MWGAILWIITLAPIIAKSVIWFIKFAKGIAPRVATTSTGVVWATVGLALVSTAFIGGFAKMLWHFRFEMYNTLNSTILPIIYWPIGKVVQLMVPYLPVASSNSYLTKLLSFAFAFDISAVIQIGLVGFSLSLVVGNFMRALKL